MNFRRAPRTFHSLPVAGALAWLAAIVIVRPGWAGSLFLLAPLALFPLALPLLGYARAVLALAAAAWLLIPAYILNPGPAAAAFTMPWLVACLTLAASALWRTLKGGDWARFVIHANLVVGAGWLALARLGVRPLGFEDVIVHATAVHFHYAGFLLPVLLLRTGEADGRRATRVALGGVLIGVPLVAAGITLTVWDILWLESAATMVLSSACWLTAWQQLCLARTLSAGAPRLLLMVSAGALSIAMILACGYALGRFVGAPWLDIPFMLRFHGCLQALGFAAPALVAWRLGAETKEAA